MKNRHLLLRTVPILLLLGSSLVSRSQILAQWSFNNLLAGLGSTSILPSPASLGPGISTSDYNGGTVFFGEGGWPAGPLDPAAYLEFTVKPVAAYSLTVASMQMNIRRSTTGSGAGPNNWALRSSLDNFATDISNGVLTTNSAVAIPVTFNSAFARLSAPVTFRLYGYNVTMTPGGLNRFVFDNISIGGATVLPVRMGLFSARVSGAAVNLDWTISSGEDLASVQVQRAVAGAAFKTVSSQDAGALSYHYADNDLTAGVYEYRIAMTSVDNSITYSSIRQVQIAAGAVLSVQGISGTGALRVRISVPASGTYRLTLYNMNGYPVSALNANLSAGTQQVAVADQRPAKGIYIIRAECNGQSSTGRLMVP